MNIPTIPTHMIGDPKYNRDEHILICSFASLRKKKYYAADHLIVDKTMSIPGLNSQTGAIVKYTGDNHSV